MQKPSPIPRLLDACATQGFDRTQPVTLARAPGRLDIMGGIADYTGSLVCEMPLFEAAAVAAQSDQSGELSVTSLEMGRTVTVEMNALAGLEAIQLRELLSEDSWAGYVVGCAWWLLKHQQDQASARLRPGVKMLVASDVPLGSGVSSSAAIEVASMRALAGLAEIELSGLDLALACQQVENQVVGAPCGAMDQVTSECGKEGCCIRLLCQPDDQGHAVHLQGAFDIPKGFRFAAIHAGVSHQVSGDPYTDTRTAAFMAHRMMTSRMPTDTTAGFLARISPESYESLWRQQLPEQMSGQSFIDQYQSTIDSVTKVKTDRIYHVQAAADHHVYEAARVNQFVELMEAGAEGWSEEQASQAGSLMLESHRSYSNCARLGHVATDCLVDCLMSRKDAGIFGAKITGGGCGGSVAVLFRDTHLAREALGEACLAYESQTGHRTQLMERSGPGAQEFGTHRTFIERAIKHGGQS